MLVFCILAAAHSIFCNASVIEANLGLDSTEQLTPTGPHNITDAPELDAENCSSPEKEFVSPVRGSPRCCRTCDPGTGMLRLCTDTEDTQCIACEPGAEYSHAYSATAKCRPCRRCHDLHPLAKVRNACTPTTDTECECVFGHYMDLLNQTCRPCTVCQANEGVVRPCAWNADTQCEACPQGFWSAKVGDTVKCIPCRTCSDDEKILVQCSPAGNAVCCPKINPNCTLEELLHEDQLRSDENINRDEHGTRSHNQMLPIYCSIMGLIIVFLLFYVIYKLWKQRESIANGKLSSDAYSLPGCNGTKCHVLIPRSVTPSHKSDPSVNRLSGTTHLRAPSTNEWDPLLSSAVEDCKNMENHHDLPLNSVPLSTLGQFSLRLAEKDWQHLACKMQDFKSVANRSPTANDTFNRTFDAIFQSATDAQSLRKANDGRTENVPGENLIGAATLVSGLCADQSLTVGSLIRALQMVGYDDLIAVLSTSNVEPTGNLNHDLGGDGYSV